MPPSTTQEHQWHLHGHLPPLDGGYAYERATRWVSGHLPPVCGRSRRSVFEALKNAVFLRGPGSG